MILHKVHICGHVHSKPLEEDKPQQGDVTENIKILATDDEKIKLFGEMLTNDSSRKILQLLFGEEMTANQIAQKTDISLQLVKYHLIKLQEIGVVKIQRTEKNSKSRDMKVYTATQFSVVVVPPKLSKKTKESKLLIRSFRHIYKVAGLGVAAGVSGLFSLTQIRHGGQQAALETAAPPRDIPQIEDVWNSGQEIPVDSSPHESAGNFQGAPTAQESSRESRAFDDQGASPGSEDFPGERAEELAPKENAAESALAPASEPLMAEPVADMGAESSDSIQGMSPEHIPDGMDDMMAEMSGAAVAGVSDLFVPAIVITAVLGGLAVFYLYRHLREGR